MNTQTEESLTKQLNRHLHAIQTIQEIAKDGKLLSAIKSVQNWQKLRFLDSQQALFQNKQSNPAIVFLAAQLYQLENFNLAQRDPISTLPKLLKFMPKEANTFLVSMLELKALSLELDFELAQKLKHSDINLTTYSNAYSQSSLLALRQAQIDALQKMCSELAYLTRIRGVSFLLFLYRKPASKLGVEALHNMLQQGVESFTLIDNKDEFIQALVSQETKFKQRMLSPYTNELDQV